MAEKIAVGIDYDGVVVKKPRGWDLLRRPSKMGLPTIPDAVKGIHTLHAQPDVEVDGVYTVRPKWLREGQTRRQVRRRHIPVDKITHTTNSSVEKIGALLEDAGGRKGKRKQTPHNLGAIVLIDDSVEKVVEGAKRLHEEKPELNALQELFTLAAFSSKDPEKLAQMSIPGIVNVIGMNGWKDVATVLNQVRQMTGPAEAPKEGKTRKHWRFSPADAVSLVHLLLSGDHAVNLYKDPTPSYKKLGRHIAEEGLDIADGLLAKIFGGSDFGPRIDAGVDKVATYSKLLALTHDREDIDKTPIAIMLARDIAMTAGREMLDLGGISSKARHLGKVKHWLQQIAIAELLTPATADNAKLINATLWAATTVSMVSFGDYAQNTAKELIKKRKLTKLKKQGEVFSAQKDSNQT